MDAVQAKKAMLTAGQAGQFEKLSTESGDAKPKVFEGRLVQREFNCIDYVIDAPAGVTPADLLRGEFFGHVAADLKPFNRIEVRADDGTWLKNHAISKLAPFSNGRMRVK